MMPHYVPTGAYHASDQIVLFVMYVLLKSVISTETPSTLKDVLNPCRGRRNLHPGATPGRRQRWLR